MSENELFEMYKMAVRKLILLDYDGTLVNHISEAENAFPSNQLIAVLEHLSRVPNNKVVIVTGRQKIDIEMFLGHLPIDIIAEHGALYKLNNSWNEVGFETEAWKDKVGQILKEISLLCPKSRVEKKKYTYSWHYRDSAIDQGYYISRQLINLLNTLILQYDLKIIDGNKVVEIMSSEIGKGRAINNLFEIGNYDFVLAIGDDLADEEMFNVLDACKNSFTIKVGSGETKAKLKVNKVENVLNLLTRLTKHHYQNSIN